MRVTKTALVVASVAVALFVFGYAPTEAKAQCFYPGYYSYGYSYAPAYYCYAPPPVYYPAPVVYAPPVYYARPYYPAYAYPTYGGGRSWGFNFGFGYRHR